MIWAIVLFLLSGLTMTLIVPPMRGISAKVGLVDLPNQMRKVHTAPTPVVGGLGIGVTISLIVSIAIGLGLLSEQIVYVIAPFYLLFLILGALDDRFDVSAKYKFLIQILAAIAIVHSGVYLSSVNDLLGVQFPEWLLKFFTAGLIVLIVNAYNLVDGIDGLLGSFFGLALVIFILTCTILNMWNMLHFLLILLGAVLVFLKNNMAKKNKIFMGDAGALSLGIVVAILFIHFFEKSLPYHGEFGWMHILLIGAIAFPVLDSIAVFAIRLGRSGSIFKADKTHFHHYVVQIWSSHKSAVLYILATSVFTQLVALLIIQSGSAKISILSGALLFLCFRWLIIQRIRFRNSEKIIQRIEG